MLKGDVLGCPRSYGESRVFSRYYLENIHVLNFQRIKEKHWGLAREMMAKSTGYSSRGPGFNSHHPHGSSQL